LRRVRRVRDRRAHVFEMFARCLYLILIWPMFANRVVRYIILINYFNEYKRTRARARLRAHFRTFVLRTNIARASGKHHPLLMELKRFVSASVSSSRSRLLSRYRISMVLSRNPSHGGTTRRVTPPRRATLLECGGKVYKIQSESSCALILRGDSLPSENHARRVPVSITPSCIIVDWIHEHMRDTPS